MKRLGDNNIPYRYTTSLIQNSLQTAQQTQDQSLAQPALICSHALNEEHLQGQQATLRTLTPNVTRRGENEDCISQQQQGQFLKQNTITRVETKAPPWRLTLPSFHQHLGFSEQLWQNLGVLCFHLKPGCVKHG